MTEPTVQHAPGGVKETGTNWSKKTVAGAPTLVVQDLAASGPAQRWAEIHAHVHEDVAAVS